MQRKAVKSQDYLPARRQWTDYSEVQYQPTLQDQAGE